MIHATRDPQFLRDVTIVAVPDPSIDLCCRTLRDLGATLVLQHNLNESGMDWSAVDVVLAAGTPAVLEGVGINATLCASNPRLIVAVLTPFGMSGPRCEWLSCDLVAAASGGQLYVTGREDREPIALYGSQALCLASLQLAVGVTLALLQRQTGGSGKRVAVSMQEAVATGLDHVLVRHFTSGDIPGRSGSTQWNKASTVVPCRDGHMVIYPSLQWDTLVEWMQSENREGDLSRPEFQDPEYRSAHWDQVTDLFSQWSAHHGREELFESAQLMRLPWAPTYSLREVSLSPQLRARDFAPMTDDAGKETDPPLPCLFSPGPRASSSPSGLPPVYSPHALPLQGVRILDFTRVLAGPYATRILADFGAEVIKVQSRKTANGADADDQPYYAMWNRNKRNVCIDLDRTEGLDVVKQLVRVCDVVIENFSPRVLDNWGLEYAELERLNPSIILLRMSAAGQTGPWRDVVGYGPTLHALAGLTASTRYPDGPPLGPGFAYSDIVAGLYAALTTASAVFDRHRTGRGCAMDLSEYEALVGLLTRFQFQQDVAGTPVLQAVEQESDSAAPYGCYPCQGQDRWCAIAVFDDDRWRAFCEVLGNPAFLRDDRFSSLRARREHAAQLRTLITPLTGEFSAADLAQRLQRKGVHAYAVQNAADLSNDPQLTANGFFAPMTHPILGEFTADRGAIRLESARLPWRHAPALGADTQAVLRDLLGWTADTVQELRQLGILD